MKRKSLVAIISLWFRRGTLTLLVFQLFFALLLPLLLLATPTSSSSSTTSSSSSPGGVPTSPIRHWDASWAASCVQGTAIATTHDDCVILFLRSPATNVWKGQQQQRWSSSTSVTTTTEEDLMGLKVYPLLDTIRSPPVVEFAPSFFHFGNYCLCAMTGLASDVEHLCRILQKQVESHWNIYDDQLTVHAMTGRVSDLFRQTAFARGGRPFGVQTMLVGGGDDIDPAESNFFCLYTIDPSGSWQSWPWGTAIGKYAKEVRSELAKKTTTKSKAKKIILKEEQDSVLSSSSSSSDERKSGNVSLKDALEHIIQCWIETCKSQNVNIENLSKKENFQVLILRRYEDPTADLSAISNKRRKLYTMKQDDIKDLVEQVIESMEDPATSE